MAGAKLPQCLKTKKSGPATLTFDLEIQQGYCLLRYMLMQNVIKLSAVVHEILCFGSLLLLKTP